jgi:hypothetical protein
MALVVKNRVQETTSTTGTGTVTLSGTAPTGFQTFTNAMTDGDKTYYQITNGTDWEIGLGTYASAGNTLARTTVYESSNSNNAVNFTSGSKDVFMVFPAQQISGTIVYDTIDDLPLSNVQAGAQAFVASTNRLYLNNGTGWYNIALVNQTPSISGNQATYILATDGTATVVTLSATDPEGIPITWSYETSGLDSEATISNADNVFTITPSTNNANEGGFTVTFRASDGVNIGTASSNFTLAFFNPYWDAAVLSIGTNSTNGIQNSTFIDRSTNAFTVTSAGTPAQTAFNPHLENWSVEFDNSSQLKILSNNVFAYGTNDFTWELFIYVNEINTADYIIDHGENGGIISIHNLNVKYFNPTIGVQSALYATGSNSYFKPMASHSGF